MADEYVRIKDQVEDTSLSSGDYVIVDSQSEGTRKFDLGAELTDIKQDLSDLQDEIEGGGGGGLTNDLKAALDQLAQKVAYIDDDGQDYYDALHNALYPPASLSRISCVYSGGSVTDRTPLSDLRADLVVTAHYSNGTTATVTAYTLSGTLVEGTSTVTVSYGGKITTFDVTVTSASVTNPYVSDNMTLWLDGIYNTSEGHDSSATSWEDLITGDLFENTGITVGSDGMVFDGTAGHGFLGDIPSSPTTIEVVIDVTTTSTTQVVINGFGNNDNGNVSVKSNALLQRKGYSNGGTHALSTGLHTHTFVIGTAQYVDGVAVSNGTTTVSWTAAPEKMAIGNAIGTDGKLVSSSAAYPFTGTIKCVRFYSDALTAEEVASNFAVDATRFGIS